MMATSIRILLKRILLLPPPPALEKVSVSSVRKAYVEAAHTAANHRPENEKFTKSCDRIAAARGMNDV
jgi:hypothetical protein